MLVSETFDRGCTPRSRPPRHSRSHERAVASGCDSPLPSAVPLPTHQQFKLVAGPRNQRSRRSQIAQQPGRPTRRAGLLPSAAKLSSAARWPRSTIASSPPWASIRSHPPASAPPVRPPPACPRAREPRSATRCAYGRPPPDQRRHLPALQLRQVRHRPQGSRDARANSPSSARSRPSCSLRAASRAAHPPSSEITAFVTLSEV